MNEWLDNFQLMGVGLNEGEKTLMRMAMNKERERIIKLLEKFEKGVPMVSVNIVIALIKGENK